MGLADRYDATPVGLTLALTRPAPLLAIEVKTHGNAELRLIQRRLVGFDEGKVMTALAHRWDFPTTLVLGMRHCAQKKAAPKFSKLAAVLHLDADASGPPAAAPMNKLQLVLLSLLRLDPQALSDELPDMAALADTSMLH